MVEFDIIKKQINRWNEAFKLNTGLPLLLTVKKAGKYITRSNIQGKENSIPMNGFDIVYGHYTTEQNTNSLLSGGETYISGFTLYFINQDPCLAEVIKAINESRDLEVQVSLLRPSKKNNEIDIEYIFESAYVKTVILSGSGVLIECIPEKVQIDANKIRDTIENNHKIDTDYSIMSLASTVV